MLSFLIYIAWIVLFSLTIRDEFCQIAQDVAAEQTSESTDEWRNNQTSINVEHFRQRYLALTKVVRLIDDVMCLYNLMMFAVLIPAVCISIYVQMRTEMDMDMALQSSVIYAVCCWLVFLAATIWAGTLLNESVS